MKVLLDSVILIDHFNGIAAATQYLSAVRAEAALSVITRAEVLAGFQGRARRKGKNFLDCFPTLSIDQAIADAAALLRAKYRWKLPDAFQAAIARSHRLKLATRDRRDFPPERHRFVIVPYRT
ncbi:MAG: PIN domain-containing protein [Betaproteobacteria bacterium]|nr:PIN domain-containing protein [Betaproteobacteria bacterium]